MIIITSVTHRKRCASRASHARCYVTLNKCNIFRGRKFVHLRYPLDTGRKLNAPFRKNGIQVQYQLHFVANLVFVLFILEVSSYV